MSDVVELIETCLRASGQADQIDAFEWLGRTLVLGEGRSYSVGYLRSVYEYRGRAGSPLIRSLEKLVKILNGQAVIDGLYVMGKEKTCVTDGCQVRFVDNHPRRKYCPICRP